MDPLASATLAPPLPPTHPILDINSLKTRTQKSTQKQYAHTFTKSATRATKKEYSGELGFQNDSQMESKMDPKVIQKGSLLKNTTK